MQRQRGTGARNQRLPISATKADLPISKDDFIFGVVSVDATGHESVAVLPVVGR